MMNNILDFNNMIGTSTGEEAHMLGKFLYFSLANVMVEKDALKQLCQELCIPNSCGKRMSVADAFRSATGDIRDRLVVRRDDERKIYAIYCRDNERSQREISRELVKETLCQQTNQYKKLANIYFDVKNNLIGFRDVAYDPDVDAYQFCQKAEELFQRYQQCVNRRQIETICQNYLRSLEATKTSSSGYLFFVPRQHMDQVDTFELFLEQLNALNCNENPLTVNSFYIIDDAKQRDKMTEEFYLAVKKEIATYTERANHLIHSACVSPAIMERWVTKINSLEQKKRHYEDILRRELDGLDDDFSTLKFMSQELSLRANNLRFRKAA